MTQPLLQAADLRNAAGLTSDTVAGLASLVEAMRESNISVLEEPKRSGAAPVDSRSSGATGMLHELGSSVPNLRSRNTQALLDWLAPVLTLAKPHQPHPPEREAIRAALNGVLGDHLATGDNALAITMQFRRAGRTLPLERRALRASLGVPTPKLLVLLHGLCRNDIQWLRAGHDHGAMLALELGYTPVYLHYNSGLSVSTNGRILADLMEVLYSAWPVPITRLAMIGHGMGGLVARSAIHHAALVTRYQLRWPGRVKDLVCLGTPHHGTGLDAEDIGVDLLVGETPYGIPLSQLSKVHTAGIRDFRMGNVVMRAPGQGGLRLGERIELPAAPRCFAIAASLGPAPNGVQTEPLDDGVVPVVSALGLHAGTSQRLGFLTERQAVVYGTGHLDLLSSPQVYGLLRQWLDE